MGLNKIDLKVLRFVCDRGAQTPEREIAHELRLKPSTVAYCLKKMAREKVILRYNFRLNYPRLGFSAMAWVLFKFKPGIASGKPPASATKEMLERLLFYPQVHVVSFITGENELALKVIEKSVASLNNFVMRMATEQNDVIESPKVVYCTKMYKTHNIALSDTTPCQDLGKTDFEILNCRMLQPGLGVREMAALLSVHRNTVSKRWKMMWKQNVITKKTPVVHPDYYDQLGIGLKAIMFLEVETAMLQSVAEKLDAMPEVHELNHVLAGQDLMAIVRLRNVPELFDFLKKIYALPGVKETIPRIVLYSQPHKSNYLMELSKAGLLPFKLSCCKTPNSA